MQTKKVLIDIAAALLILLFLYASVVKLLDMDGFVKSMGKQPLPHWLGMVLVWLLPLGELAIVAMFFFKRTQLAAFYASGVLMAAFTGYIALIVGDAFAFTPCVCGGIIESLSWQEHLYFNVFFLGISLLSVWLMKKYKDEKPKSQTALFT